MEFSRVVSRVILRGILLEKSQSKIVKELGTVSDTTLATKFNVARYEELDAIREILIEWVKENFDESWVNWLDAIEAYQAGSSQVEEEEEDQPETDKPKKEKPPAKKAKADPKKAKDKKKPKKK